MAALTLLGIHAGESVLAQRVPALAEPSAAAVTLCIFDPVKYCSAAP